MFWSKIERPQHESRFIRTGALFIDIGQRRATLHGKAIELSPLLFRLLSDLAHRPGDIISRAELKRALWPYATRIDTERRLNTAMRALRSALGDDAEAPRYIETVRCHGYRWIATDRGVRGPKLAAALITATALSLALSPQPTAAPIDVLAVLKAQNAVEQWRRQPSAARASQAAALLRSAGAEQGNTPSVLAMKAEIELGSEWRWAAAANDYRRALDADPNNADARLGLAWLLANQGRRSEALALVADLLKAGVQSGDRRASLGWLLIRAGRPDLATELCGREESASMNDLSCAHTALAAVGQLEQARAAGVRLMRVRKADLALIQKVERMPAEAGYKQFLLWRARDFLPPDASYFDRAQVLADAGFGTEALDNLARSVEAREPLAVKIISSPAFMGLRTNPRYQALVRRVGLAA